MGSDTAQETPRNVWHEKLAEEKAGYLPGRVHARPSQRAAVDSFSTGQTCICCAAAQKPENAIDECRLLKRTRLATRAARHVGRDRGEFVVLLPSSAGQSLFVGSDGPLPSWAGEPCLRSIRFSALRAADRQGRQRGPKLFSICRPSDRSESTRTKRASLGEASQPASRDLIGSAIQHGSIEPAVLDHDPGVVWARAKGQVERSEAFDLRTDKQTRETRLAQTKPNAPCCAPFERVDTSHPLTLHRLLNFDRLRFLCPFLRLVSERIIPRLVCSLSTRREGGPRALSQPPPDFNISSEQHISTHTYTQHTQTHTLPDLGASRTIARRALPALSGHKLCVCS